MQFLDRKSVVYGKSGFSGVDLGGRRITNTKEIPQIQKELTELQEAVLTQNEKNQSLLKEHVVQIRNKIANISNHRFNPYAKNTSIYSQKTSTPSIIDLEV